MMRIGELAAKSGVNVQTIRYYERRGLLERPVRTDTNYRLYSKEAVRRVRFVKRAQELGFSLAEIGELLALRLDAGASCSDVLGRARAKIADIEDRMRSLRSMKQSLAELAAACSGRGSVGECPILESLDRGPGGSYE